MALVRIEPDFTSEEAAEWVYEFVSDLFEHLDFEDCVGAVNGEVLRKALLSQVYCLEHRSHDTVAEAAIDRLAT